MVASASVTSGCSQSIGTHVAAMTLKSTQLVSSSGGRLRSSQAQTVTRGAAVTVTNISGMVDSVFFPASASVACGFSWQANRQTGSIGVAGRTYQGFDLAGAKEWEAVDSGEACASGQSDSIGILASYLDLDLTVDGESKVVRIAMGDSGVYKQGDLLIQQGTDFYWATSDGASLVIETETRPDAPAQLLEVAQAGRFVNKQGQTTVLALIKVGIVDSYGQWSMIDLAKKISKISIDFDLSEPGIEIVDPSSDVLILASFSARFLSKIGEKSVLATVSPTWAQ